MSRLVIYDCNLTLDYRKDLPLDEWHQSLNADDIVVLRDTVNNQHLVAHRQSANSTLTFIPFDKFFIPVWCSSRYPDALRNFDSIMKYAEKYDLSARIEIPLTDVSVKNDNLNSRWDHVDVFRYGDFFGRHDIDPTWYRQLVLGQMRVNLVPATPIETQQDCDAFTNRMMVHFTTPRRDYFFATDRKTDVFERDLRGEFVCRRSRRTNKMPELKCLEGDIFIYHANLMMRTKDALSVVSELIQRNPVRAKTQTNELIIFHSSVGTLVYSDNTLESHVKRYTPLAKIVVITSAPDRVLQFKNKNKLDETVVAFWHPSAKWREPWCRAFIIELILSIGGLLVPHVIFEIIEWLDCLRTWGRFKLVEIIEDVFKSTRQIVARRRETPVTRLRSKIMK